MINLNMNEEWVQICRVEENEICFTKEYLEIIGHLGWEARKFGAQLITHWEPRFQHMLDYFGPDDVEEDWYTGVDGEGMDVGELLPDLWETHDIPFPGLDGEWHRDILRAKLISIKLPKKLIEDYVKAAQKYLRNK